MKSENTGIRHNQNKLRWRNIPLFLLRDIVEVGVFGEQKYDTWNFLKGLSVSDTLDAAMRHLDAFTDPNQNDNDEESGLPHIAHAAWNLIVAAYMVKTRKDLDDRLKNN